MLLVHSYVTKCTFVLKESMSPSGLSGFSVPFAMDFCALYPFGWRNGLYAYVISVEGLVNIVSPIRVPM